MPRSGCRRTAYLAGASIPSARDEAAIRGPCAHGHQSAVIWSRAYGHVAGRASAAAVLAMVAERALGVAARDRVNARQLVLEGLAETRREPELEPGAVLADRRAPAVARILSGAVRELQEMLEHDPRVAEHRLALHVAQLLDRVDQMVQIEGAIAPGPQERRLLPGPGVEILIVQPLARRFDLGRHHEAPALTACDKLSQAAPGVEDVWPAPATLLWRRERRRPTRRLATFPETVG